MIIEQPHGYLRDAKGRVVIRFGNWATGEHKVPDEVESVDYVSGVDAHTETVHEDYLNSP